MYIQQLYMKELEELLQIESKIPLSKATVVTIIHTNSLIKQKLLSQLKPLDLSIEQFNVLRILRGQKGKAINLQDIQQRMVNRGSNTTRLVDKLIKKEFVERELSKVNRRKVEIKITQPGLETLKKIDPLVDKAEKEITKNLTQQELIQLNKLLIKLKT